VNYLISAPKSGGSCACSSTANVVLNRNLQVTNLAARCPRDHRDRFGERQ
jgi:hypothetical protein